MIKRFSKKQSPAVLQYEHGAFRTLEHGLFVYCSYTGKPIFLGKLKYWSVQHQEPYQGPHEAMKRFLFHQKKVL